MCIIQAHTLANNYALYIITNFDNWEKIVRITRIKSVKNDINVSCRGAEMTDNDFERRTFLYKIIDWSRWKRINIVQVLKERRKEKGGVFVRIVISWRVTAICKAHLNTSTEQHMRDNGSVESENKVAKWETIIDLTRWKANRPSTAGTGGISPTRALHLGTEPTWTNSPTK